MATAPDPTRPLTVDKTDAWNVHDCLAAALSGFGGRAETSAPWHGEHVMAKLSYALLRFEEPDPVATVDLDLSEGELRCIDYNVPRTAYAGAGALLLRVFRALSELQWGMPLLTTNVEPPEASARLARWGESLVEPYPES